MKPPPKTAVVVAQAYAPYPKSAHAGVSAPPRHPMHGGGGHRGHPGIFRGGRSVPVWGGPWTTEIVTTTEVCRTWSNPIAIPQAMQVTAKVAVGASGGRPTTMRGDDGALYLFSLENGILTGRRCVDVAVS